MDRWRKSINFLIAILVILTTSFLFALVWNNRFDTVLSDLVVKNFAAIVGLPFAFVAAFVVVAMFRQADSPIEFEAANFKLKGAAGEIVLWAICYIAIAGSIAVLWIK